MTDEQRNILIQHCNSLSDKSIAERLQVSETKVRNWRLELGFIKKERNHSVTSFKTDTEEYFFHDPNLATI